MPSLKLHNIFPRLSILSSQSMGHAVLHAAMAQTQRHLSGEPLTYSPPQNRKMYQLCPKISLAYLPSFLYRYRQSTGIRNFIANIGLFSPFCYVFVHLDKPCLYIVNYSGIWLDFCGFATNNLENCIQG